jgi:hypothetical protein
VTSWPRRSAALSRAGAATTSVLDARWNAEAARSSPRFAARGAVLSALGQNHNGASHGGVADLSRQQSHCSRRDLRAAAAGQRRRTASTSPRPCGGDVTCGPLPRHASTAEVIGSLDLAVAWDYLPAATIAPAVAMAGRVRAMAYRLAE